MHRTNTGIDELKTYFTTVIDWIRTVFAGSLDKTMRGLDWGSLYETYHTNSYKATDIDRDLNELLGDPGVRDKKGIYEYLLGGKADSKLLKVRIFDNVTKRQVYATRTESAKAVDTSNCPLCAVGTNDNATKIYPIKDMEANHVTAWSKGGATTVDNCQMLCTTHNRAKGNR